MNEIDANAKAIFFDALEQKSPQELIAFLDEKCAGDAALRSRVEELLRAHKEAGNFLGGLSPQESALGEPVSERPGAVIGPYKLLQQIGDGGMGTVYMAEQTQPLQRKVALKIIKPGMDSRQVIARFEAERQALALMDHPNIAMVHDGGTTDTGRPYFVMELVKGVPITKYCDDHHLTPRDRLELFVPVCQAVQHAHQKGIIHRDLKPSNVMVCLYDGKPVPKVIDFGVAKATGPKLTERTMYTEFGQVVGTLEYMSPEQAELNQLDIDTRSDIYSLGVLLYELLTGTTPLNRKQMKERAIFELLRMIREEEPPKPSTRLSTTEELPSIAANRGLEPKKLSGLMRGEPDWIVMKALEKDRNRRYATANGFAADVQRYLAGEPVLAVPASRWYRLRKLVRRHRGPVVAAGLVLLALVGGISGTTWGLLRAVEERDAKDLALKAEQQAREDETRARRQAFAALRSMTTDVVDRKFAQGTVTEDDRAFLRGVIAQYDAFAAIQGEDAESRAVRAEGRLRVGKIRYRLGELKEAALDYDQALGAYKQLAAEFAARPEFRQELATSHTVRGNLLRVSGRPQEAEKDYDQALRIQEPLAADFPSRPEFRQDLANSHNNRGNLLRVTGRLREAEQDYNQALRIEEPLAADFPSRPEFRRELARSHHNRALLLSDTGQSKDAEQDYTQAVSIYRRLAAEFPAIPEYRQQLAGSHNDRANLLGHTGRLREAEEDYAQAQSIHKQLAADFPARPEFRQDLATSHNNQANLLQNTGRFRESEPEYDQALRIQKQLAADFSTRPEFREDLARSHNNLGVLLNTTGRLDEAEKELNEALSILKQLTAEFPNQPDLRDSLANTSVNLVGVYEKQGNWANAKRLLLEGRPHHLNALKANPRNPDYRRFYRNHLNALAKVHAALLEQVDAVNTAETCRDLGWDAPGDAYNAACSLSLCVPVVAKHATLDDRQRKEVSRFYGDAAMRLLRDAVSKGYKDVPNLKKDTDLDPLRQREDFQKLVAQLEGKAK
jgi:serine/threonine protein kinase/Tfp pilus assembly protein PilF